MTKPSPAVSIMLLLCALPLLAQKRLPPQAIRFEGATQYTQQELAAAAGLKPGVRLNSAEVKIHARQLNDTGVFREVRFNSDRKGLVFTLTPSSQLFPMHLDNVPLTPGKELDAKLHDRFPLYRSTLLPATGSMVQGICRTFEEMLAAKGVKATVEAAVTSGVGPKKITAINFTVTSPAVRIGRIQLSGVSPAMMAKADQLASQQNGNSFDTENSATGLQHLFEDLYHDQDYAAVEVNVAQADAVMGANATGPNQSAASSATSSIDVPYAVTINEGAIYKLGKIDLPPDALVTRADIEKVLSKKQPGSGRPLDLFLVAVHDAYNAHGYLDCVITLHPSFNQSAHIVNYTLEIAPGPQYHLASVKFEGAPDAMASRLKQAWKIAPGEVFDESYLSSFAAQAQKKDKPLSKWLQTEITTYDFKPDSATHEVNCIYHFSKPTQGQQ